MENFPDFLKLGPLTIAIIAVIVADILQIKTKKKFFIYISIFLIAVTLEYYLSSNKPVRDSGSTNIVSKKPHAKPIKVAVSDFTGMWEINAAILSDNKGDMITYSPIRFEIDKNGELKGTAGKKEMLSSKMNGVFNTQKRTIAEINKLREDLQAMRKPRIVNIKGRVHKPHVKTQYDATIKAINIEIKFNDNTEATGTIGVSEEGVAMEKILLKNGQFMGTAHASKT